MCCLLNSPDETPCMVIATFLPTSSIRPENSVSNTCNSNHKWLYLWTAAPAGWMLLHGAQKLLLPTLRACDIPLPAGCCSISPCLVLPWSQGTAEGVSNLPNRFHQHINLSARFKSKILNQLFGTIHPLPLVITLDCETETAVVQLSALCLLCWVHSHAVCRC